jgi:hypothetical protein
MTVINNNNLDRTSRLTPSELNDKFNDVITATLAIDDSNTRNSGVDNPQFAQNLTDGTNDIQLYHLEEFNCGSVAGTSFVHGVVDSALPNIFVTNSGSPVTLREGDLIRVYWFTQNVKGWASAANTTSKMCWAQSLQWSLAPVGAFTDVPDQGSFNAAVITNPPSPVAYNGIDLVNCNACNFLHHISIIDDGSAAPNVAPVDAVPAGASYINNDVGTNYRIMSNGSWVHKVTAGEAGTYPQIRFRLVINGLMVPIYDSSSNKNFLVRPAVSPANGPYLIVYNAPVAFMIMRSQ